MLDRPGRILLVLVANQYMCILSVSIAPFFCRYCWSVDGLGVAVVLVCLRCFICREVDVGYLCSNTSYIVTICFPFRLPLVHTLGVSSPGGRWEVLLFFNACFKIPGLNTQILSVNILNFEAWFTCIWLVDIRHNSHTCVSTSFYWNIVLAIPVIHINIRI